MYREIQAKCDLCGNMAFTLTAHIKLAGALVTLDATCTACHHTEQIYTGR